MTSSIEQQARQLLRALPDHVQLIAAAKTRTADEIRAVVTGGVRFIGQNYVQEAERAITALGRNAASWHMIGHLQRNKVGAAVRLFDAIQTVDSLRLAERIDREARAAGREMQVLVEINSAREAGKTGLLPEDAVDFVLEAVKLSSVRINGLMTMGPLSSDPEDLRPFFAQTKGLFDRIGVMGIEGACMKILSMGMSDSYEVAIEEGSNMIRIGTALFDPRS